MDEGAEKRRKKDLIVSRGWIFRGESQLWPTKHLVKISRLLFCDRLSVKVPFFIALCLFWRSNPFGFHLLTLKCCCWQELGSERRGAAEQSRGRHSESTSVCFYMCVCAWK